MNSQETQQQFMHFTPWVKQMRKRKKKIFYKKQKNKNKTHQPHDYTLKHPYQIKLKSINVIFKMRMSNQGSDLSGIKKTTKKKHPNSICVHLKNLRL